MHVPLASLPSKGAELLPRSHRSTKRWIVKNLCKSMNQIFLSRKVQFVMLHCWTPWRRLILINTCTFSFILVMLCLIYVPGVRWYLSFSIYNWTSVFSKLTWWNFFGFLDHNLTFLIINTVWCSTSTSCSGPKLEFWKITVGKTFTEYTKPTYLILHDTKHRNLI